MLSKQLNVDPNVILLSGKAVFIENDMIVYKKIPKDFQRKLLELMCAFKIRNSRIVYRHQLYLYTPATNN